MQIQIRIFRKSQRLLESQFEVNGVEHFESIKSDFISNMRINKKNNDPFIIDPNTENSFIIDCRLLKKSVVSLKLIK